MYVERLIIKNFKRFENFDIRFSEKINVIVGDNEAGKSTILEAIDLALSGIYCGRYIKNEISQSIFNKKCVDEYLESLKTNNKKGPPEIVIEIHAAGNHLDRFKGDNTLDGSDSCGFAIKIKFDERNADLYQEWIEAADYTSLPIEFYTVTIDSFQRNDAITFRHIPIKSALIDSTSPRNGANGDVYVSKIIKDTLDSRELIDISQAYRKSKEYFAKDESISAINSKIEQAANVSNKSISITIDQSSKNAWESGLHTYLDGVPFSQSGKGEQSIVKTKIALAHKKTKQKNVILIEEPENHLSHTKLNDLLRQLYSARGDRQIIITTHSSFVANKLGLDALLLLGPSGCAKFSDLSESTSNFFKKIPGYDTLRLILCKKAILVEGDCDELIVQRAYMDTNSGKLPIEDGIEVISVGTTFLRFLEIAKLTKTIVRIVTDNDGHPERVIEKYKDYQYDHIKVCCDYTVDDGDLQIGTGDKAKKFNYNTLEPKLLKENSAKLFGEIFGKKFASDNEAHKYMLSEKTECALAIFSSLKRVKYPQYILDAIAP